MRHIHLQLAADQAEHHSGSVTEARRPDYLKRTKRPVSDLDSDFDYSMDVDEDLDTINPNTGVTESPVKGRRIALFQETSEESFEQSLLAGGYRGYGDLPAYTEPQTPDANNNGGMKSKTALSQRAMDWLHLASPTRPTGSLSQRQNPTSAADEPHQDVAPSEREVKKRKRLAAFGDADPPPARGKLVAVEIEGRGRVLMDKLLDERPESPTAESPTSKKRGGGRKKKASARVAAMGTSPTKRGGKAVAADENVADAEEVPKPNWLDAEFPWSMRARERHDWNRRERAEKMKWIERFLDRDSDEEENEEDQSLGIMVGDEGKDVLPLTFQPPRAGRGKMIPLKTNPDARPRDPPERMLIPSDPADARAALLSKRDAEIGSDEEVCICRGRDDGRELVQCDECHTWYHLQCIGIRDIAELGREEDPWYCADCLDSEMPRDEPSSEPVFVPTDDEPLHRKRRDPLMSSSSALSPSAAWSATRGIPKTPVRGRTHEAFSSSSWDASSRIGPTTPSSSARRSRVYQTPTIYDGDGDDDQPFSLSSPTRSTRFSGGPFTTPKMSSMSAYLGSRSNGPFQTPSRPSRRSGGALPFGFDESVGRTVLTYPYDDTPIRRAKPPREERSAGHMLEGSPLAGRGRALYPLGVPESPTTARLSARKARGNTWLLDGRVAAYVLDLRARFITKETAVAEYEVWRTRALELEKKLQEVEEKYQGEHVELAALQAKILSSEVRPSSPPANSKSKGQKKKAGQKKPAVVPNPVHATFNLDALQVPPLFEPHNILSSLQNLEVLAGPLRDDRKKLPCDAFVSACHRALDSLTALLVSGLRTADDRTASALDTLLRLSPQLITLVLPILARVPRKKKRGSPSEAAPAPDCSAHAAILDRFVGSLATSLLVPLVHSFASSSIAFYAVAISEPPKKPHSTLLAPKHQTSEIRLQPADVRPRLSSLLHALVHALVKLCASGPSSTASTATAGEQRRLSSLVAHTVDFVTLESNHDYYHDFYQYKHINSRRRNSVGVITTPTIKFTTTRRFTTKSDGKASEEGRAVVPLSSSASSHGLCSESELDPGEGYLSELCLWGVDAGRPYLYWRVGVASEDTST
ncbi:hypothetical protein EUX98_g1585 [Antrodiella citrinella]|uniref:PHD-type domain-containing protein n=1 Tax=Antrodiella citrinella TaxID=2447956 RepID=A0A4S4N145_9APHY|nr:hypothetical protein EUX98_g1585 [Antrodiella citrinella]